MNFQPNKSSEISNISTGHLPPASQVQLLLNAAFERYKFNNDGQNAQHYPALARVPEDLFGLSIVSVDGSTFSAGDALFPFTIMSVSKPFVFALLCQAIGPDQAREMIGVNATGLPFNSIMAIELSPDRKTNPIVNPGAIAATSLVPGSTAQAKWQYILEGLSRFAGRELIVNEEVYASASLSNHRNHSIARLLEGYDRLFFDPVQAIDLYTRQCSLDVTAVDLAVMAATLADGGYNPITKEQVVESAICPPVLATMATAGMYETSGDWLYEIGLPGKSGVGGGIITVAPGKGGLGTFAPPLDDAGNSVRGQLATRYLSTQLGLNIFASKLAT
jgi:glutaminase